MLRNIIFVALTLVTAICAKAQTFVWSNPTSVAAGKTYTISVTCSNATSMKLLKNGAQVATATGNYVSVSTSDTTLGTMTFQAFAYGIPANNGAPSVAQISITIVAANQPPIGVIDSVPTTVLLGSTLTAAGWAADNEMGAPIDHVQILIDSVSQGNATTGGARPDVATAYSRANYTNSGWSWTGVINSLSAGVHTLSVVAWDNQAASTNLGSKNFTVTVAPPPQITLSANKTSVLVNTKYPLAFTAAATAGSNDLTGIAIDYLAPGSSTWVSGWTNWTTNSSWSGGPLATKTIIANYVPTTSGAWQFRAAAKNAAGAVSAYSTITITVAAITATSDFDGDGMPDQWELAHGLDPEVNDANGDLDGDGLSNLAEYLSDRDPNNSADASALNLGYQVILRNPSGAFFGVGGTWKLSPVSAL